MTKCLEGRSLNKFIDFMNERQDHIGKKKLGMLNNSLNDRLFIAMRYLGSKHPFYQLPNKIADSELPLEFKDIMEILKQQ